jgi:hypothetical protein
MRLPPGAAASDTAAGYLKRDYLIRLGALLAVDHGKLDLLTLCEGAESVTDYGAEVNEQIRAVFTLNKPVSLGVIEPLHGAGLTI